MLLGAINNRFTEAGRSLLSATFTAFSARLTESFGDALAFLELDSLDERC
jgi:hypothetical protein